MINADMQFYSYFTFGDMDGYGQPQLSENPIGEIKIAIYTSTLSTQDNVNYKDCSYIGVTQAPIDDKYVIKYGEEKLKVLYVNPQGRYKQVFLKQL